MANKRMTAAEAVSQLSSGMTIGIGGWSSRRKPLAIVKEILKSDLTDLTIVAFGGPEVGLLVAAGKVKKVVFGYVTMDGIPLDPHFRKARQTGAIEVAEYGEGMVYLGLYAAGIRMPFLPTRVGLGSDVMTHNPDLLTVADPYGSGEEFLAMPAIHLDAALIHMNQADELGNAQCLGPDPYFDNVFAMAAEKTFVSVERIVATEDLLAEHHPATVAIKRMHVHGVIEAPGGAGFTSCAPDYGTDFAAQKEYAAAAASPEAWEDYRAKFTSDTTEEHTE